MPAVFRVGIAVFGFCLYTFSHLLPGRIWYFADVPTAIGAARYSTALMATFPINITLVTAAAIASYFLIEKPCLRFRQRLEQMVFSVSARVQTARAGAGGSVVPDGAA